MNLTVRGASLADEAEIVRLWRACGLVTPYNDPASDFRFAMAGDCSTVLVAVADTGGIKGSVMVGHDGHRGWLYYVCSALDMRGRGIGRRMVRAGETWLQSRGVEKAQLLVRESNTKVVSFYERLGYDVAPRVVMSRWLTREAQALVKTDPPDTAPDR